MFYNIQMLRACAAMIVVFFHSLPHYQAMGGNVLIFQAISVWGFAGVDIFFVISGFIMAHTTLHKERTLENAQSFLMRRFARIYLGYWPFFLFMLLLTLLLTPENMTKIKLPESFFLTSTNMFELLLPVTWSLTYELYFYFIFSLLFLVSAQTAKIIIYIALIAMLLRINFIYIDSGPAYFFLSHFLVEFFLGAFLYIHHQKLKSKWLIIPIIIIAVYAYKKGIDLNAQNNAMRVFTFGLGAFFSIALFITLENCKIYKAHPFLVSIGDASYTLYLSHLGLLTIFYFSGFRDYLSQHNQILKELGFFAYITGIVLISIFLYKKMELPIYQKAIKKVTVSLKFKNKEFISE